MIDPRAIAGNKTYHYKLGFPETFRAPKKLFWLTYTDHALSEAEKEEHGAFSLPKELNTVKALLVQIVLDPNGRLVQATWRVRYDDEWDAVLVVDPDRQLVVTAWLNHVSDDHPHLAWERYDIPE